MSTIKIILCFSLLLAFAAGKAQEPQATIRVYINNEEINYKQWYSSIKKGDTLTFEASNPNNKSLEIEGYEVFYYSMNTGGSKEMRQETLFSKVFNAENKNKSKKIIIAVDDLLKQHDFAKIDVQLGNIYGNFPRRAKISMHSSSRRFSFMLQ